MRLLVIEGGRCLELERGEPAPLRADLGPTEFYRDGAGVIRLYTPIPRNIPIQDVLEPKGANP